MRHEIADQQWGLKNGETILQKFTLIQHVPGDARNSTLLRTTQDGDVFQLRKRIQSSFEIVFGVGLPIASTR